MILLSLLIGATSDRNAAAAEKKENKNEQKKPASKGKINIKPELKAEIEKIKKSGLPEDKPILDIIPVPLKDLDGNQEVAKWRTQLPPNARLMGAFMGPRHELAGVTSPVSQMTMVFAMGINFSKAKAFLEKKGVHLSDTMEPPGPNDEPTPEGYQIAAGNVSDRWIVLKSHQYNKKEKKWQEKTLITITQFITSS